MAKDESKTTQYITNNYYGVQVVNHGSGDVIGNEQTIGDRLLRQQGFEKLSFVHDMVLPSLELPEESLVPHLSLRVDTVRDLTETIGTRRWLALYGGASSGKTHLAILTAQNMGSCRAWIRLRDCSRLTASTRLDTAMMALQGIPSQIAKIADWRALYNGAAIRLSPGQLLVLDDLPTMQAGDELTERLRFVYDLACKGDFRILSTSTNQLPQSVSAAWKSDILEISSPQLSTEEINDILLSLGAPERLLAQGLLKLIWAGTHGHPALVTAFALKQRERDWHFDDEWFANLFPQGEAQDYAAPLRFEAVERMLETVEDESSRELLSRLSLIAGSFDFKDAQALCEVDRLIERPAERLQSLRGLWVQSDLQSRYLVSPLVIHLGRDNLLPSTRRACYGVLGDLAVARGNLHQWDVLLIHNHYIAAEQWDRAGTIVLGMLMKLGEMEAPKEEVDDFGLAMLYESIPMPAAMSLPVRLGLRGAQISFRRKMGKDVTKLLNGLDTLLSEVTAQDEWALLPALFSAANASSETGQFARSLGYLKRAQQLMPSLPIALSALPTVEGVRQPKFPQILFDRVVVTEEQLLTQSPLWWSAAEMRTIQDVDAWMKVVESLTPEERDALEADFQAPEHALLVAGQLWKREFRKPEDEQNWPKLELEFADLGRRAANAGLESLWACFQQSRIVVIAEPMKNIPLAQKVADEAIQRAVSLSLGADVQFILCWGIGMQYAYVDNHERAAFWLLRTMEHETEHYALRRMNGLLWASRSVGLRNLINGESQEALAITHRAVAMAESLQLPGREWEHLKSLGELSLAQWLDDDIVSAFHTLDRAIELFLDLKPDAADEDNDLDAPEWQSLFWLFSNLVNRLVLLAQHQEPPQTLPSGETIWVPMRGDFLRDYSVAMQSRPQLNVLDEHWLAVKMTCLADALTLDDHSLTWAKRAATLKQETHPHARPLLLPIIIVDLLKNGKWGDSISEALEVGVINTIITRSNSDIISLESLDVSGGLNILDVAARRNAESYAVVHSLFPLVFWLANLHLEDSERARDIAGEIVSFLEEQAQQGAFPELWNYCAAAIQSVWISPLGAETLIRLSNGVADDVVTDARLPWNEPEAAIPRLICCLGATLQKDITLENALLGHIRVAPFLNQSSQVSHVVERLLFIPFLWKFWNKRFLKSRFLFTSPAQVEIQMNFARNLSIISQPKALLSAIAKGLSVRLTSDAATWLRSDKSD